MRIQSYSNYRRGRNSYTMIKLLLILFVFKFTNGQILAGRCFMDHNRSRGICRPSEHCPQVFELLKCNGIKPTICGFEGLSSTVCCPIRNVNLRRCNPVFNPTTTKRPVERISVQKCAEYKTCGGSIKPVIIGGIDAHPGEFPHMAALGWALADGSGFNWNCGGSLISENFVITAGHCTDAGRDTTLASTKPVLVRLGAHNIKELDSNPQDISILSIIKHPEYKPPLKYNDIALIELIIPARFDANVKPICLWQSAHFPSEKSIATGWGKLGYASSVSSDILQKVDLKLFSSAICSNYYKQPNRKLPMGIIESQLCAGELEGGKDTCQGDSGGPLQIVDPELSCAYHLVGLTSFGIGCGGANSPAVYTRVSSYIDWIESVVWP